MLENNLYKELLDQSSDYIWIIDTDFNLIYANPAYQNYFRILTQKEIELNQAVFNLVDDQDYIKKWKSHYQRGLNGESFDFSETFNLKKENNTQMLQISIKPIFENEKEVKAITCQSKLISETTDTETLLNSSLDVFCTIDKQGYFVYVNNASIHLWGYTPEELIGKPFRSLIYEDDFLKTIQVFDEILLGKEIKSFNNRYKRKDGNIAYNLWSAKWDIHSNFMYCVARDHQEIAEEKQQLKLLESVITNTNDAILITEAEPFDLPGPKIIYVNQAFTKMTGYEAHEVIGKTPRILQGPNSDYTELARLSKAIRNWESCEITTINYKKNGEEFWINFSVSPVANEKGWFTHWIAIERDVTDQKQKSLEKELISKISLNFNIENDIETSTKGICKTICDFGKFDFAEFWMPNLEQSKIQLIAKHAASSNAETFHKDSKNIKSFQLNEGLPGFVWQTKVAATWNDLSENEDFIRKKAAKIAGIDSALGIPLLFNQKLVGVLVIGVTKNYKYLDKYLKIFKQLENFIGSEINRKKLETDLLNLYDTIPDILCLVDFNGRILKINKAGCELLGYTEEELIHHTFYEFVHPDDQNISFSEALRLEQGEESVKFENRYITKNGDIIWLSWTSKSVLSEQIIYATAKNITKESKLKELNIQAGKLAKIGSWEIDLVKNKLYWSTVVHQLHETDPQTYIPDLSNSINFYRSDFRPIVQEYIDKCIKNGTCFDFEAVILTQNNNERWVRVIGNSESMKGNCLRIFGSFQDISDRKLIEENLKDSENRFKTIFQIATLGIAQVNPATGKIILVNSYYEKITGYSTSELLEMSFSELTHPDDRKKDWEIFNKAATNGEKYQNEKRYIKKDGSIVWVCIHVAFIRDENGIPTKTVAICEDITDRKQIENQKNSLLSTLEKSLNEIYIFDANTLRFIYVNKGALNNLGYTESEIAELTPLNLKPEYTEASFQVLIEPLIKSEKDKIIFFTNHQRKNGTLYPVEVHLQLITEDDNKRYLAIILDITERKTSENQVINTLKEKNDILESIGDAFFAIKKDFKVTYWNKKAEQILRVDREEILGKSLWEIFPDAIDSLSHKNYKTVLETKKALTFEDYYGIWLEVNAYPSEDGISVFFRDITEKKEAEQRLIKAKELAEENEHKMKQAQKLARLGSWYYDVINQVSEWSEETYRIWGFNPKNTSINLIDHQKLIHPKDWERFNHVIKDATKKGISYEMELELTNPNGVIKIVNTIGSPIFDENKKVIAFKGTTQDITDRIIIEKELRKAKEKAERSEYIMTQASNIAKMGFWEIDLLKQNVYWSEEIHKIHETDYKTYIPNFDDGINFYRHDFREDVKEQISEAISKGSTWDFEAVIITAKGNELWVRTIGNAEFVENKCVRLYGSLQNINDKKIADIELKNTNKSLTDYKFSLDQSAIIAITDNKGIITSANDNFCKISGFDRDELIGKTHKIINSGHHSKEFFKNFWKTISSGKVFRGEIKNKAKNGNFYWVDTTVVPFLDANSKPVQYLAIRFDITDRKKQEDELIKLNNSLNNYAHELERSNEELESFAFITSHDLQEPLRMITSFMDLLKRKYEHELDEKAFQYIHFATDGAKRMKQIILDLLEYSRASRPTEALKLEMVSLDQVIDDFMQLRRKLINEKSAIIIRQQLSTICTNKAAITQVLHSLLDNALKYAKENEAPLIEVNLTENENNWLISVKDNGIGINPQFFEKIFILFQRLHNRDRYEGTGIGLSIAKKHIEYLGGKIWIESEEGKGATFYFTIPKKSLPKYLNA